MNKKLSWPAKRIILFTAKLMIIGIGVFGVIGLVSSLVSDGAFSYTTGLLTNGFILLLITPIYIVLANAYRKVLQDLQNKKNR